MRRPLAALALTVLLSSCATAPEAEPTRLVIVDNGAVITIDPDGSNPEEVAASDRGSFFQPVWSPDGALLAFSLEAQDPEIQVARLDDGAVLTADTGTFPFYFSWSSTNDLAILHNGPSGLRLDKFSVEDEGLSEADELEAGQPLYYSWSPDGGSLVAHVGIDRLVTNDLSSSSPLVITPGAFPAPSWTSRGIMAVADGERQQLVLTSPDGDTQTVASLPGPTTFIPNHDNSLVALQSIGEEPGFQSASFHQVPRTLANRLVVVDIDTGQTTTITQQPVAAYFWSPVDDQLLVLDFVGPAARWSVWDGAQLNELAQFGADLEFLRAFLPFFDQYAQSVSLWSPDGSAIAFPGTIDGESGIWVQEIGSDPVRVHGGNWVSWAP